MCQSAIHSSPMSISHTAINSPNENCVKRLSIPTCKFTFSPWETETDSQDSGYHECNKQTSDQLNNQDNINSTGNTDTSGHRRRKHGWVPTTTTLNLKNDDENGNVFIVSSFPLQPYVLVGCAHPARTRMNLVDCNHKSRFFLSLDETNLF